MEEGGKNGWGGTPAVHPVYCQSEPTSLRYSFRNVFVFLSFYLVAEDVLSNGAQSDFVLRLASTLQMLRKVYGHDALSSAQVFWCHKAFEEKRRERWRLETLWASFNINNQRKCGSDQGCFGKKLGCQKTEMHRIITEDQSKTAFWSLTKCWIVWTTKREIPYQVITGDESWVLEYKLDTKRQSSEWTAPCHLDRRQVQ